MPGHKTKNDLPRVKNALVRMREVLDKLDQDPIYQDALIQRFEFTIELFWKCLKHLLEQEKIEARSPLMAFKEAHTLGWLKGGEEIWLKMLDDRNLTSHTYNQILALEIIGRIPAYYAAIKTVVDNMKEGA